jgi:hypothetical protein
MPANHKPSQAEQARAIGAYGNLPLGFEANQGQTDSRVRFLSRGVGYSLFLTPNEAVLALRTGRTQKLERKFNGSKLARESSRVGGPAVLRMQLVGSNTKAGTMGLDELPGKSNYLIGKDPANWRTNVPNYRKVAEHEVYSGIDLVYYGTQRQLEYDFVVAPGADPRAIRLAFQGADRLRIDSQGNLIASVGGGEVSFERPVAYQEALDGARQPVVARYLIKGGRNVAFKVGKHDPSRALIIDPTLAYSTYLGGSSIDGANAIAVAPDDSAFIAGGTFSSDFPTANPLFPKFTGSEDAFVSKISADGSTLIYSTYLGGENAAIAYGVAVDSSGEAYVVGTTDSPHFPVTPISINTLCGGDGKCGATWNPQGFIVNNGFVAKLNVEGSALIYSSFFGYYESVTCLAVAVDSAQNAYVTGEVGRNIEPTVILTPPATPPPLFPIVNGFETTLGNNGASYGGTATDAFIAKIDATGSEILYSSYLGGSDEDVGYGVAVDGSANAYVTGVTYSVDFPTTASALQSTYAGAGDAFLTKVNTDATGTASLLYSTYLGGSGLDQGNGVAVDASGNAYVAGGTTSIASSLGFTPPSGAYQPNCKLDSGACLGDALVAKFALSGAPSLVHFTYLGGSLADSATGIAVDSSEDAYVTGSTSSTDFPISPAVSQPTYGGGNADAFVTELNPTFSGLVYSTYLGGSNTDSGNGIAVDMGSPPSAYVAGQTCSFDFPLANPVQPAYGGSCDAFISKVSILEGIALNPAGLVFPTQSIGTPSAPQTVTLTNGDNTQTISSITITGADAGDFSETNNCPITPSTLAPGAQCTITVIFTPTATGIRKASVTIVDTAPGSPQSDSLTGSTSTVGLSASSLAFGNQQVGVTSNPQALTVTNDGTTALTISNVNVSDAYAQTNDCTTAPLQPTTNCVVNVTFTPTAPGASVGALTLIDNAPGSPQVVLLTGTGVAAPAVSLSTTSLTFPNQVVGTSSGPLTVLLYNTGGSSLTLSNVAPSANFTETNTCGASVASGGTCSISVTFTPTATGTQYGSVTLTDNAANSPQTILLAGTGVLGPVVTLLPATLTFTSTSVGATSSAQTVTLTNTGSAALNISNVAASGDFAQTNNCGASVAPANNCTISVTFTPTANGNRYGSVTIADNAANSPQTILLSGIGGPVPTVTLLPPALTFGIQTVTTTSSPQPVTLTNTGAAVLNIASIVASSNFAQTNNCGTSLSVGASCTISVTFSPTAAGTITGAVTVTDNAPNSPQTVTLSGTGQLAPVVSLLPATLTFTNTSVGATSAAQNVTLANTGSAALNISGMAVSGDFAQTNNCGVTVAAGNSCTISITFTPTASGNRYGSVTITDNAANSPQNILMAGNSSSAPAVAFLPTSLTFASQIVNTTSAPQNAVLTNTGGATLTITSIIASGDFAETNSCGPTLASGASCTIAVTFTPTAPGPLAGAVTVTDNAPGSPQTLPLNGNGGQAPVVVLAPTSLTFSGQVVGSTSAAQTVTLTNAGSAALSITSISVSGDFAQINTCESSVAPGIACTVTITFTPTALGNRYGAVTITDNAVNSPQTILLAGNGLPTPVVSLSVTSLTFSSQPLGTTSSPQTVTMSNTGTSALTITSIVTTGDFAQLNTCGASLAAGASCAISVTFTPTAARSRTGSLTITDNAVGSPQIVSLGGSGSDFTVSVAPTSASVIAGNSVVFTFTVAPAFGFNAKVTLGCSGAPRGATCSVSPSEVTLNGTNSIPATVTVTTAVRSMLPPRSGPNLTLPPLAMRIRPTWFLGLLLLAALLASQAMPRRRRVLLRLTLITGLVLLWVACGGGGSQVGVPDGTPAGNYTLTLSGTSGNVTHDTTASLTVE